MKSSSPSFLFFWAKKEDQKETRWVKKNLQKIPTLEELGKGCFKTGAKVLETRKFLVFRIYKQNSKNEEQSYLKIAK